MFQLLISGLRPWVCHICNKTFTMQMDLNYHLRIHYGDRQHVCEICKKSFMKSSHVEEHMRTHTQERPFSCTLCDKTFRQKHQLTRHIKLHNNDLQHSCEICEKESKSILCRSFFFCKIRKRDFICKFRFKRKFFYVLPTYVHIV